MKEARSARNLLVVALCAGAVMPAPAAKGPRVEGGALEFSLPDIDGSTVGSSDESLAGKVLLVDLWGTWCPPCITSIPTFVDLQSRYGDEGLAVIGIAFEKEEDAGERQRRLRRFREEHGINYIILDGGTVDDFASSLPMVKKVQGLPIEILAGRDGRVAAARNGYGYSKKWARRLEREIEELLGEAMTRTQEVAEMYRAAVNDHDIERALSYLSPDFKVRFAGTEFELSKEQLRPAMGWDAGANGRIEWELESSDETSATYLGSESNDFLKLIGIPELRFRSTFTLDQDGLIATQLYEQLPGRESPEEALKPAVEWASRNRPEVLQEIYPDGRLIYTERMARRWVDLLREWKASEQG